MIGWHCNEISIIEGANVGKLAEVMRGKLTPPGRHLAWLAIRRATSLLSFRGSGVHGKAAGLGAT